MELLYRRLKIRSRLFLCQDSEFPSTMETSSVDNELVVLPNKNVSYRYNVLKFRFFYSKLDLRTAISKPYKKPNSNLTYIYKQSNHLPSIIKNLPKSINKRLSTNSKNAQIFNEACPPYTEALKRNG